MYTIVRFDVCFKISRLLLSEIIRGLSIAFCSLVLIPFVTCETVPLFGKQ